MKKGGRWQAKGWQGITPVARSPMPIAIYMDPSKYS
jgi:hypothetical protein